MKNASHSTRYVSLTESAEYTNLSTRTIRRYIAQGLLTGYRVGPRQIRVDLNELDEMFRAMPTTGTGN
ncbi:helix-turn-helix domain-containing protein [Arthrobacter sp. HLT1-21]